MTTLRLGMVLLAFSWLAGGFALAAPTVALVTDFEGSGSRALGSDLNALSLLDELSEGERIHLGADSRLVLVYLESGEEFAVKGPAELELAASRVEALSGASPERRQLLAEVGGIGGKIEPIDVAQLSLVMRGSGGGKKSRFLHDTKTLTASPYFHWQVPAQGLEYEFILADDTGEVILEKVTASGFQLPAGVELVPGITYSWEADPRGNLGGDGLVWGTFEVADENLRNAARRLRPGRGASFSARVVYAIWLEQQGLRDEARRYWSALAMLRPNDPKLHALAEN